MADLGVAKATAHASGLTQVVGTPAYMAPEQALGTGLDVRADVHSLGAVAYVLLTGHPVREDGLTSLLEAKLPPAPSTVAAVPSTLDAVLLKSLAPAPEDRWADIASFVAALLGVDLDCATATPPAVIVAAHRPGPRPAVTAVLALVVLVIASGLSYVVTGLLR